VRDFLFGDGVTIRASGSGDSESWSVVSEEAAEPVDRFKDWPENLPREELIRLLRGYCGELLKVEQMLASLFPDMYPLGDGEVVPVDYRETGEATPEILAAQTVAEVSRLRRMRAQETDFEASLDRARASRAFWAAGFGVPREGREFHTRAIVRAALGLESEDYEVARRAVGLEDTGESPSGTTTS
jgi:hypothetical protein